MPLAPTPRAPKVSRSGLIVLVYGALGAAALIWSALRGQPDLYRTPASTPVHLALSPLCGLATGLGIVFCTRLLTHRLEWARTLHREFHAVVHELSSREIVLLALASSLGEELFFRGALLPVVGLVPQALAFGALHVRPHARFLPWTAMSFVIGLFLGGMVQWLGDLGGPIVCHFTINLLNLNYISRTELRA